jgi:hypothetical protein
MTIPNARRNPLYDTLDAESQGLPDIQLEHCHMHNLVAADSIPKGYPAVLPSGEYTEDIKNYHLQFYEDNFVSPWFQFQYDRDDRFLGMLASDGGNDYGIAFATSSGSYDLHGPHGGRADFTSHFLKWST